MHVAAALKEAISPASLTGPEPHRAGMVRLLTCGSVDDGKSTLIGRLLWDAAGVTEDQRAAIALASHNRAFNGEKIDFSLLLDGLQAEREQGITIDIAWRYFETPDRRFVIIDSPGHEQYTRNMATGASHADIAILLVDARHGPKRQTRRHAAICDLVGIKKVILAVNKMDLVDFAEPRYREIESEFAAMAGSFGFTEIVTIPVAALSGDNVAHRSLHTPWYGGPTLLDYLENVDPKVEPEDAPFRMPVQLVLRASGDFRGYAGTISSGRIEVGDRIVDARSGLGATLRRIATMDGDLAYAGKGEAVTLVLDTDLDISRGAVLSEVARRPVNADVIEARLVWLSETPFDPESGYLLRTATDLAPVTSMSISALVNFETLAIGAGACMRRQRHRRLPHPARPLDRTRSVPRAAADRQFHPGQRHRRGDGRRRRHHLGAGRRAGGRRQCARAQPRAAGPRALLGSRRFTGRSGRVSPPRTGDGNSATLGRRSGIDRAVARRQTSLKKYGPARRAKGETSAMVDLGWAVALLPLVAAGFGVGLLVGLTGVGGGALMTPLLISSFGVSPQVAVGTDLLYASITKTAGSWRHHVSRHVEWPIVLQARRRQPARGRGAPCRHHLPAHRHGEARPLDQDGPRRRAALERARHRALSLASRAPRRPRITATCRTRTLPTVLFGVVLRPARHADLGRRRRHRRHRAGDALSHAAGEAAGRLRRRACRAADADRRLRPSRARQCRWRAACSRCCAARSPAS